MRTLQLKHLSQSKLARKIALWALSIGLLSFGFLFNLWHVAEQEWFGAHQRDTESLIIGRMVKSRQDGIFSVGGLTGAGVTTNIQQDWIAENQIDNQYATYLNRGTFDTFSPYMSQTGGQGIIFSLMDRLIPLSPRIKLWSFYVLTALLSAIALTAIVGWFYDEFGGWVAVCVLCSCVLSQWLTVFGKNLWWSLWAFYLPMIVVLYCLKRHRVPSNRQFIRSGILITIAVFIKCFINGFEYITTTLLMMVTPFIYYAILDKWSRHSMREIDSLQPDSEFRRSNLSQSHHVMFPDRCSAKNGFMDGVTHVIWSFGKRTYGDAQDYPAVYAASLEAGTIDVVITYMNGIFFDFNNYLSVTNHLRLQFSIESPLCII